jgi:hypothetical protein
MLRSAERVGILSAIYIFLVLSKANRAIIHHQILFIYSHSTDKIESHGAQHSQRFQDCYPHTFTANLELCQYVKGMVFSPYRKWAY